MKREIVCYPHPCLAKTSEEITEVTDELRELAGDMVETMYESEGIGLAAPQVGECVRLIVVDVSGPEKREDLRILVNPRIIEREGEMRGEEGCLSVKDYRSDVTRAEKVRVTGSDLDGNMVEIDAGGLLAVCLQHEIDHLDGTLFIDHISRRKRSFYDKKLKKKAKAKG